MLNYRYFNSNCYIGSYLATTTLKFVTKEIQIVLPGQYAHKAYGKLSTIGKLKSNNWHNDGSWSGIIEIPGGLETDLYDLLNNLCQGNAQTNVIKVR